MEDQLLEWQLELEAKEEEEKISFSCKERRRMELAKASRWLCAGEIRMLV